MDFLYIFHFATAIPFGYAIFYGGALFVMLGGAAVFITALLRRRVKRTAWLAGAASLFSVIFVVGGVVYSEQLEINPYAPAAEYVGVWEDGSSRIEIRADQTATFSFGDRYARRVPAVSGSGVWSRKSDFTIQIMPDGSKRPVPQLRMIIYGDQPRIILEDFDDFDMWDGRPGFRKVSGEARPG